MQLPFEKDACDENEALHIDLECVLVVYINKWVVVVLLSNWMQRGHLEIPRRKKNVRKKGITKKRI